MSDSFGASALRLSSFAARLLGWRPPEFWAATPAELAAALTSPDTTIGAPVDRAELERLMERENANVRR